MSAVNCYAPVSTGNVAVGALLTAGTFLSFVPQVRSISRDVIGPFSQFLQFGAILWERSSQGVSVIACFLNALCQALLSLNGLVMQYPNFECCTHVVRIDGQSYPRSHLMILRSRLDSVNASCCRIIRLLQMASPCGSCAPFSFALLKARGC